MNLLNHDDQDMFSMKEQASTYMSIIEEQQDSLKQLVICVYNLILHNLILLKAQPL